MAGRRNGNIDYGGRGDNRRPRKNQDEDTPAERRAKEYVRSLLAEKLALDKDKFSLAAKLLDQEIVRAQAEARGPKRDNRFVDVYREKTALVAAKVLVPVKEHPSFNFVGKLLGPKGSNLKGLQEETMCRMSILGRGSMRDSKKEEELRQSLDTKFAHLSDDLHVEITALGPPAEAYARIAFALTEIQKHLVPDDNDGFDQDAEVELFDERPSRPSRPAGLSRGQGLRGSSSRPPPLLKTPPRLSTRVNRGISGGRGLMDDSYESEFGDSFNNFTSGRPSRSGFGGGDRFESSDFDVDYFDDEQPSSFSDNQRGGRVYKEVGKGVRYEPPGRFEPPRRSNFVRRSEQPRYRSTPYARAGK